METVLSFFILGLLFGSIAVSALPIKAYADANPNPIAPITPFQLSINEFVEKAKAEGKRYPDVKYDSSMERLNPSEPGVTSARDLGETRIVANTVIEFQGPEDIGLDRWLDDSGNGTALTEMLSKKYPQAFASGELDIGHGARVLTVQEEISTKAIRNDISTVSRSGVSLSTGDVVMGLTIDKIYGYSRHDTIEADLPQLGHVVLAEDTIEFNAGFTLALRLPATVEVEGPVATDPQNPYFMTTALEPKNFDSHDYEMLGIPGLNGHEFEADAIFNLSVEAYILGHKVIDVSESKSLDVGELCQTEFSIDCQDFVTPFGKDGNGNVREFPLPTVTLNPKQTGLKVDYEIVDPIVGLAGVQGWVGIGLRLDPEFRSDKITAEWSAAGSAIGTGDLVYRDEKPAQLDIGPIALDKVSSQDAAEIVIENFEYHLDIMKLKFGANLQTEGCVTLIGFCLPLGIGDYSFRTDYLQLFTFDLTEVTGELVIPQHEGTPGVIAFIPIESTDELFCGRPASEYTITGKAGDYVLFGTQGSDRILGLGGDDKIYGYGGNDFICSGPGNDMIFGGDGDDIISGGRGDDIISGSLGDDTLIGGTGWDTLSGGRGSDTIQGQSGNDVISGGWGNDNLDGNEGEDKIDGGKDVDSCVNAELKTHCE
jgi:hypothetical protein